MATVKCSTCKQIVGVVDGKVAPHQTSGSGSAMCSGSGKKA
ncbi:hypothetical protein GCM10009751_02720 [Myceligenerans crystallogenes]|uniref:DUF5679 domain-containing protein n=1 Tax=Myceligenerans crystallogenes TaxID=316335 RepID=A0ABN2N2V6_9MICO